MTTNQTAAPKVIDIRIYRRREALRQQGRDNWNKYIARQEQAFARSQKPAKA